ncbi:MAG: hypothetical protein AB8G96_14890 [Phycisphaerales bacterium]
MRHAFAIKDTGPAEPTPEQADTLDRLGRLLERRGLTTPGLIALEMARPLNGVASAAMQVLQPTLDAALPRHLSDRARGMSQFLEHRGSIDTMVDVLAKAEARGERGGPDDAANAANAADSATQPAESHQTSEPGPPSDPTRPAASADSNEDLSDPPRGNAP